MAKKEQKKSSKKTKTKSAAKSKKVTAKPKKPKASAKKAAAPKKKAKAPAKKTAAPKKKAKAHAKKAAAPKTARATKSFSITEFADMTYLTEYGVKEWLQKGLLKGSQDAGGNWQIEAANLEDPNIKRFVR